MTIALRKAPASPVSPPGDAPDTRPVERAEADEELAVLAKALGHPARVQILRLSEPKPCPRPSQPHRRPGTSCERRLSQVFPARGK